MLKINVLYTLNQPYVQQFWLFDFMPPKKAIENAQIKIASTFLAENNRLKVLFWKLRCKKRGVNLAYIIHRWRTFVFQCIKKCFCENLLPNSIKSLDVFTGKQKFVCAAD